MGKPGFFKRRHYSEWLNEATQLHERGQDDKALKLLNELIDAAEAEGRAERSMIPPAYVSFAATILQSRGDHQAAVDVLDRYQQVTASLGLPVVPRIAAQLRAARRLADEEPVVENTTVCPSCGAVLSSPIKRSGKCQSCGSRVLARKHRGVTVLRTEEQQAAWETAEEALDKVEAVYERANMIGVSDAEFDARLAMLTDKYGRPAPAGDVFWSLAMEKLTDHGPGTDSLTESATINRVMALHLFDEGRDWIRPATEAARLELKAFIRSHGTNSQVMIRGCVCDACLVAPEPMSVEQAQASDVPPHADCSEPPCSCSYYKA